MTSNFATPAEVLFHRFLVGYINQLLQSTPAMISRDFFGASSGSANVRILFLCVLSCSRRTFGRSSRKSSWFLNKRISKRCQWVLRGYDESADADVSRQNSGIAGDAQRPDFYGAESHVHSTSGFTKFIEHPFSIISEMNGEVIRLHGPLSVVSMPMQPLLKTQAIFESVWCDVQWKRTF